MKILLILAANKNDPLTNDPFMPLSLPIIASLAPEHEYKFIDMLSNEKVNYNEQVDIVGISYRITGESTAFKIADEFRKRGKLVILGGPQASSMPFEAKKHANVVVIGEAEPLWEKILKDYEKKELKDFYVANPKKFNSKGYSIYQLFDYYDITKYNLMPKRDLFKKKYQFDTVYATRGCPIDCDFCSVSKLYGKKIRKRNIEDVIKEINSFKNYYYLLDETVFGRKNCYDFYFKLYEEISKLKKKRLWVGQANLDAASDPVGQQVIKMAAKAGLIYVSVGIESINYDVLKKNNAINKMGIKKKSYLEEIKQNIMFIQEQGIIVSGWFTIGYEEDSIQTFYDTLDFCLETNILPILGPLEALPGTRLYNRLKKEKRLDNKKKINIIHPYLTDKEIFKALDEVNKIGYSFLNNIKRTKFYFNLFDKDTTNIHQKIYNKIHKTIFLSVLQHKLKKGLMYFINESKDE